MKTLPTQYLRKWRARCFVEGVEYAVVGDVTRSMSVEQPRSTCSIELRDTIPPDIGGKKCYVDISIVTGDTPNWVRFFTGYAAPDVSGQAPESNRLNIVDVLWKLDRSPLNSFIFYGTPLELAYRVVFAAAGISKNEMIDQFIDSSYTGILNIVAPRDYIRIEATENLWSVLNELNEFCGLVPLVYPDGKIRLKPRSRTPEANPALAYSHDRTTITDTHYRIYQINRTIGLFEQIVSRVIVMGDDRTDGWKPAGMWEFASEDLRGKTDSISGRLFQTDAVCVIAARRELKRRARNDRTYDITVPADPDVMPSMSIRLTSPKYELVEEPLRIISVNISGAEMVLTCSAGEYELGSGEELGDGGGGEDGSRPPGEDPGDVWGDPETGELGDPPDDWGDPWPEDDEWGFDNQDEYEAWNDGEDGFPPLDPGDELSDGAPDPDDWERQPDYENTVTDPDDPWYEDDGGLSDYENDIGEGDYDWGTDDWGDDWGFDWDDTQYDFNSPPTAVVVISVTKETILVNGAAIDLYDVSLDGSGSSATGTITDYTWSTSVASDPSPPAPGASSFFTTEDISGGTVTLTVTDDAGGTDTVTVNIPDSEEDLQITSLSVATNTSTHRYFNGSIWVDAAFPDYVSATSIAVPPIGGFPILASNGRLYSISTNDAEKLVMWGTAIPPDVGAVCMWANDDDEDDIIIAGTSCARTNGGDEWRTFAGPGGLINFIQLENKEGTGYIRATTSDGTYHSFDNGASWEMAGAVGGALRGSSAGFGHVTAGSGGAVFDDTEEVIVTGVAAGLSFTTVSPGYTTPDFILGQADGALYRVREDGTSEAVGNTIQYPTEDMIRDGWNDKLFYATGSGGTYKLMRHSTIYLLDTVPGIRIGYGLGTATPSCKHCVDVGQTVGTSERLGEPVDPPVPEEATVILDTIVSSGIEEPDPTPRGWQLVSDALVATWGGEKWLQERWRVGPDRNWHITHYGLRYIYMNSSGKGNFLYKSTDSATLSLANYDGTYLADKPTTLTWFPVSDNHDYFHCWFLCTIQQCPSSVGNYNIQIEFGLRIVIDGTETPICPPNKSGIVFGGSPFSNFSWTSSPYIDETYQECDKLTRITLDGGKVFDKWCFRLDKPGVQMNPGGKQVGYTPGKWRSFGNGWGNTIMPIRAWLAAGDEFTLELCPPEEEA